MWIKKRQFRFHVIIIIFLTTIYGCQRAMNTFNYPEKMPEDFNFIAKINSQEYTINTFDNEFRKSLQWGKDTVIEFKINEFEKRRIYQLIKDYDIVKYPNYFTPPTHVKIDPNFNHYFKTTFDSINVEINWEFNTESEESEAKKLNEFFFEVFKNILENEQIKQLPKSERVSF